MTPGSRETAEPPQPVLTTERLGVLLRSSRRWHSQPQPYALPVACNRGPFLALQEQGGCSGDEQTRLTL